MKFEDIDVWKRSARLSADIYQYFKESKDFGFRDQITRSGLSIPSNIAEGLERGGDREVIRFLSIAKGSCGELRTQIYIGIEIGYIEKIVGQAWIRETQEISAMLSGFTRYRTEKGKDFTQSVREEVTPYGNNIPPEPFPLNPVPFSP